LPTAASFLFSPLSFCLEGLVPGKYIPPIYPEQLNMLKVAKEVCFDSTFKAVPGIYYQLIRVFARCGDTSGCCEVCLLQPREGVALVPCGHSRFRGS